MNTEFISIKDIAAQVYSHPLMRDISFERIIRDSLDLMKIVGCPVIFEDRQAIIDIDNWKGVLPCDYYDIIQVILDNVQCDKPGKYVAPNESDIKRLEHEIAEELNKQNPDVSKLKDLNNRLEFERKKFPATPLTMITTDKFNRNRVFVKSTGTFDPDGLKDNRDLLYKITGNIIHSSIEKCKIKIAYKAIKCDKDGYPMIIDNASFIRALVSYIKKNYFTVLFECGQLQQNVLQNAQQEYSFNIAQASNDMIDTSPETMVVLSRIYNTMLDRPDLNLDTYHSLNQRYEMRLQ